MQRQKFQLFNKYVSGLHSTDLCLNNLTSIYPITPMYIDTVLGSVYPTGNKRNTRPCLNRDYMLVEETNIQ